MITNIAFGADPELFLQTPAGKLISSIDKIGGSKLFPRQIGDDAAVQEDNVAVEFNTKPAMTKEDFIRSLHHPLDYLRDYAQSALGLQLAIIPSAIFPEDELEDPRASVFGCDPDMNAWTGEQNPRPVTPKGWERLRTCGGHLHVSWDDRTNEEAIRLVKALDLFVGVRSTLYDTDAVRRTLYGKAGAFRHKPYGVEYRTLSNWWITDDKHIAWVFDSANEAIKFVNDGNIINKRTEILIQQAINNNNKKATDALIKIHKLSV